MESSPGMVSSLSRSPSESCLDVFQACFVLVCIFFFLFFLLQELCKKLMIHLFFFLLPSMSSLLWLVLDDCVAVEACRVREGIRTFLSECRRAGWSRATSYRFYITGMDEGGVKIPRNDHLLRGASLVRLTDMWLSTWT